MHRSLFLILIFSFFLTKLTADDSQAWGTAVFHIADFKQVQFSFSQQYRISLSERKLVTNLYSIQAKRPVNDWLDSEVHFTLIYSRGLEETLFTQSHRLELELNPHFNIEENTELRFRNRYELIHRQNAPKQLQRFRQRQQLVLQFDRCLFNSISMHNEVFYSIDENRVNEYRFVPLEVGFTFGSVYIMIRWRKPTTFWRSQQVWGVNLNF